MSNYTLYTKNEDKNKRLDQFLKEQISDLSRNQLRSIIQAGDVKIGFKVIDDIAHPLDSHKKVIVSYQQNKKYAKAKVAESKHTIDIIYEDHEIVVIDKKSGVLTIPTRKGERDTAIHLINNYIKKKYQKKFHSSHVVHRLDQAASGLLVFARTKTAQQELRKQFQSNKAKQSFEAIILGTLEEKSGTLTSFLSQKEFKVKSVSSEEDGEIATTHYQTKKKLKDGNSYIQLESDSKIRNQFRIQLANEGHPILGDRKYSESGKKSKGVPRLALHASKLEFYHPKTQKRLVFKSPFPTALKRYLNQ